MKEEEEEEEEEEKRGRGDKVRHHESRALFEEVLMWWWWSLTGVGSCVGSLNAIDILSVQRVREEEEEGNGKKGEEECGWQSCHVVRCSGLRCVLITTILWLTCAGALACHVTRGLNAVVSFVLPIAIWSW